MTALKLLLSVWHQAAGEPLATIDVKRESETRISRQLDPP
jgi:hypothetical protein